MSLTVDVRSPDLTKLAADVRKMGGRAEPLIKAAVANVAERGKRNIRRRAPHRTGTLQRSILPDVRGMEGEITANEKYAIWLEQGTGIYGPEKQPILIKPKRKKALAFSVDGAQVIVKSVRHPGMKARPFFKPGWEETQPYADAQFTGVRDRIVKELSKG